MSYPGNASLAAAVKDRVVSTFQQALALYKQGRSDEVLAGCNLILQMDPSFEPARKLLDKTRNPALPVDVDSLLPAGELSPLEQAREAMAQRDFQRVIHITTEILTDDLLNDDARILGDEAREKLEAGPFIDQFTRKSDEYLSFGNQAAARAELEKARALDATHPEVVRLSATLDRDAAPPQPSFVVDEPASPATGRSAAQATDFGFAFEEEKAAPVSFDNFSFDSPAQPAGGFSFDAAPPEVQPEVAKEAVTGDFDFATASVATSDEDQKKIQQYLADGDRAYAAGDHQQAIDLWSRIFLIDVTNDQASDRIEKAKLERRDVESKIDSLLASGIDAFDRGDTATAHSDLSEVLRLDPSNRSAREYLDRLGETVVEGGASATSQPYIPPSPTIDPGLDMLADEADFEFSQDSRTPPEPQTPAAKAASKQTSAAAAKSKAATGRKLPMTAIAALLAVVILGAGGWFVWTRFMSKPEEASGASASVIARASTLAQAGKYDQAIALLKDIKPSDPEHDQALVLLAELHQKKANSAQMVDGVPAEQFHQQQIAAAQQALAGHDYAAAKAAFEQAARVKPLSPDLKLEYDRAAQQVSKLDSAKALFAERKYREAIANLEQLLAEDPENANIRRLMTDAHFNLGAIALQEERVGEAAREFEEVLKVTPDDDLARRSRDLAVRYEDAPKDLLYKIYVKYLPMRQAS